MDKEDVKVVEAEVVEAAEAGGGLAVRFSPAAIEADFEALDASIEETLALYKGWVPDLSKPEEVDQARRGREHLNSVSNALNAKRIEIKKRYMEPFDAFEARVKAIDAKIKEASKVLDRAVKDFEAAEKAKRRADLEEYYLDFAPVLAPVVPFDRLAEGEKWLLKSFGAKKAQEALCAKVGKVASDWEALKALGLPNQAYAEGVLFRTLDLGAAVAEARRELEEAERIEAMRAEVEAAMAEPPAPEPLAEPEPAPPLPPELAMPEPLPPMGPSRAPLEPGDDPAVVEVAPIPAAPAPQAPVSLADLRFEPVAEPQDLPRPWVILLGAATSAQAREVGRVLGSMGLRGVFKSGTLEDVYLRETAREGAYAR